MPSTVIRRFAYDPARAELEVLPDIMRTVGNVTMDVSVAAAVDRRAVQDPPAASSSSASQG